MRAGDPEGKYYITGGADADKFHIDLYTGLITSKSTLLREHQETYNLDVKYIGPRGDNHTESVTLTITPGDKATAEYQSLEATKINIANTAKGLDTYKAAYGSGGSLALKMMMESLETMLNFQLTLMATFQLFRPSILA